MEKKVRDGVVRNEYVGPAVVVVVSEYDAEPFTIGAIDPRSAADIIECAVSIVAVENVGHPVVNVRMTIDARISGKRTEFVVIHAEVDVVRHEEVNVPVIIDVAKCATRAPELRPDAGFLGDVGKRTVSIVVIQLVSAKAGDVEICPAIVVVIGRTRSHAEAGHTNTGLRGHIGERTVLIIAVQTMPGSRRFLLVGEGTTIHKENIRPAIVVVIEDDAAASHRFGHVLLRTRAVFVLKSDSRSGGDVREMHRYLLLPGMNQHGAKRCNKKESERGLDQVSQRHSSSSAASI